MSAATACLSPSDQPSAFLTATILSRATQKQPRPAASSADSTIAVSRADNCNVGRVSAGPAQIKTPASSTARNAVGSRRSWPALLPGVFG
ncbi:MAG TPA: hypothetical protein VNF47_09625 [Streptosporangiaceae bacterium]|nr:hypothetical protein [Streptosporangiaceae bacterium]